MATKMIYNREDFIKNYRLTQDEYLMLPYEEELAYTKWMYGSILEELKDIGDERPLNRAFPKIFDDFFRINGIQIERHTYGFDRTVFTRVNDIHYEVLENADKELTSHMKLIATIKAAVFEKVTSLNYIGNSDDFFLKTPDFYKILRAITYYSVNHMDISKEAKEKIMMGECMALLEMLFTDGEVLIHSSITKDYIDYLKQSGFVVEENESSVKVLKA